MNLLMTLLLLIDFTSRDFYKTKIEIIHITQKHTVQGLILNVLVQNTNKDLEPTIILNCYGIKLISLGHDKFTMMITCRNTITNFLDKTHKK